MSLINNIPFDINRTPVEKNKPVKRAGTVPVQHSEAIHPTDRKNHTKERRKHANRRKGARMIKINKRLLGERRQNTESSNEELARLDKSSHTGGIIDLEV